MDKGHTIAVERTYKKVNAYTKKCVFEQILTIVLFVIVTVLHNVFVTSSIGRQDSSILWVMLAVTYVTLIIVAIDYIYLTCTDPVDDVLLGIKR